MEYHNWVLTVVRAAKKRVDYWAKFGGKYSQFVYLFRLLSEEHADYILSLKEGRRFPVGFDIDEEIAIVRRSPQWYHKLAWNIESLPEEEFGDKLEIYLNALTLYSISNS